MVRVGSCPTNLARVAVWCALVASGVAWVKGGDKLGAWQGALVMVTSVEM